MSASTPPPRRPLVALAGNPNAGKTTLFNVLTGSRARVGNYPGVTVERRTGEVAVPGVGPVELLDIPGTYSLASRTAEEQIAIEALLGLGGMPRPEAIVMCVDATQLVRGLYVVLQAQELGLPIVVALTMMDEAKGAAPDAAALARRLGCPVVPVVAPRREGLEALLAAIAGALRAPAAPVWRWTPSAAVQASIDHARAALPAAWPQNDAMALWALMSLGEDDELVGVPPPLRAATRLPPGEGEALDDEAIRGRYGFLDTQVAPLVPRPPDRRRSEGIDRVLIHPVAGLGVFFAIMFLLFEALFAWAKPLMDVIEAAFGALGAALSRQLGPGIVQDFLANGLVDGVGAVVMFLPQILMLFFFLGLLEDSGYMARVAYLIDRIMRSMNLHGRAFVPILSGFACAVPAIMATRTMERRRDRLLTMLVIPLTTCSARLPVYTLLIVALFPARRVMGLFPIQGLLMVGMYAFGVLTALIAAWVLSRAVKPLKARRLPFVIELPPYRMPRLKDVLRMMIERSRQFLTTAGTIIVACSILLWTLLSFPRTVTHPSKDYQALLAAATPAQQEVLQKEQEGERLRQSYAGRLGHAIEPVIAPLGFDWKIGIGLIGAFAAREVFVATMGVVYGIGDGADEQDVHLREKMAAERRPDGRPTYTPLVGLSLMLFFALSCQCMSTLAVLRRETQSLRWPLFLFAYMTVLAWVVSFAAYQGGRLLGIR